MLWSYTIRNLIARRSSTWPPIVAVAAAAGATTVMFTLIDSVDRTMMLSGTPTNAIVARKGARSESDGAISLALLQQIKVAPGVAEVSPELVTRLPFKRPDGVQEFVTVRGVDATALNLHHVQLANGAAFPTRRTEGFLVGAKIAEIISLEGGALATGHGRVRWPILGKLSAPGTKYESELWCERDAILGALHREDSTSVTVGLQSAEAQAAFAQAIARIPNSQVEALSEPAYYRRASEDSLVPLRRAMLVASLVLAIGAIAATTTTMYASFLGRIREFGTLMAIGYRRIQIIALLLLENALLVLVGAALGLGASFAAQGRSVAITTVVGSIHNEASLSGWVLGTGAAVALAIWLLSGILPIMQLYRLDVLTALRED